MKNVVNFLQNIAVAPLNSDPLEFLEYLSQFLKYKGLNFRIFDSAPHSVLTIWHSKKVFSAKNFISKDNL